VRLLSQTTNAIKLRRKWHSDPEYREWRKSRNAEYLRDHPERRSQYQRRYRLTNGEKVRESSRKWREANPEKVRLRGKLYRAGSLRANGLDINRTGYLELLASQGGTCAICHKAPPSHRRLAIDHDHKTGKIRGLLCNGCNLGIGLFHDSVDLLEKSVLYLKKHNV
jgi:hypothetical protein